jgi:hypothetical protein
MFSFAWAQTRTPLPGGGSVIVPSPYKSKTDYPNYSDRVPEALIAYRKWDSTMSGHPECDGMLAVSRPDRFESFDRFVQKAGSALSIQWSDATKIPGQPWDGTEKHYPLERGDGPNGEERMRQMAVHRPGFFGVYDHPARLYAVAHRRGVHVAVWLFDKHGGVTGARKLTAQIADSFQA